EAALETAIDSRNIIPLRFALGRASHDRQDYRQAFEHYSHANTLRASEVRYDPEELTAEVSEFIRDFDPSSRSPLRAASSSSPVPVFLISMPRSGSTLLEQMLDRHEDIEA